MFLCRIKTKVVFILSTIFLEWEKRADVILLINELIFILEYKTADSKFTHDAITQVWDYALDLKNFQEGSLERIIVPILVAPSEKDKNCNIRSS